MKNMISQAGKRPYQKPCLLVEDLALAQSIAAGCSAGTGSQTNLNSAETCYWDDGAGLVYFSSASVCQELLSQAEFDAMASLFCYNNPDGGYHIFNS